jgi:hypothetical protein
MKFARWVFLIAGLLGLLPLVPVIYSILVSGQAILPNPGSMGLFFYAFLLQYVCWQILYFILARDPLRFRPMMILAFFAQLLTPFNTAWWYFYGFTRWVPIAIVDLVLAILFLVAFWITGREPNWRAA